MCVQVELGSAEGKTLTLQSQFGGQQAGLRVKMKGFSVTKDIRGGFWHSWPWLQDRGLPLKVEVTFGFYILLVHRVSIPANIFLLVLFVISGSMFHPGGAFSASVQGSAHRERTQAAHLWLERQHGRWTSGCTRLLLATAFQPNTGTAQPGHGTGCSV